MMKNIKDELLLSECKLAVQAEKQATARVLEYLAEIDSRRLWLREGYSSLFDFCIRFLNYSEGETNRRIQACRLANRIEEVKPLLEDGSLSLTTLSLLSPLLNSENAKVILPQVALKSTREVEKVIKQHFPDYRKSPEFFKAELDDELLVLLEEAKKLSSEKNPAELLRKILKSYVRERKTRKASFKNHTRYVPVSLAREIREESNYRCSFLGPQGTRCNQTAHLQIDHKQPWAMGGSSHDKSNLRVLCKAHNLHLARLYFPKSRAFTATSSQRILS